MALAVADVVTYRSLKSFLYDQVDQSLESAHGGLEHGGDGRGGGDDRGPAPGEGTARAAPGTFVEVRDAKGAVVSSVAARLPGGQGVAPALPAHIGGLHRDDAGEPTRYLTAPASQAGGPEFRVRVGQSADGGQLILGLPLTNTDATLHRLLLIELVVTAVALAAASGLGWWLVKAGLRRSTTSSALPPPSPRANSTGASPATRPAPRSARSPAPSTPMLGRIEGAFAERDATEAELRRFDERLRRFVADAATGTRPGFDPSKGGHVGANGTTEALLTGDTAEKVKAAALAAVPGGTIERVENDAEGSRYEAHMTKADGTHVTVKVDAGFNVTGIEDGHGR